MSVSVWPALGVAIAAVTGASIYALMCALRAWRSLRRFRRKLGEAVDGVTAGLATGGRRLDGAGGDAARLAAATERLRRSLATARLVAAAYDEFRATAGRFTRFVPSR